MLFIPIVLIFYYNTIGWLVGSWMYNEYYSHGFLVPLISGYIIRNKRKELSSMEKKPSQSGLALFAAGIIIQGLSVLWTVRFLSGISLLITIAGAIIYLYGWEFMKKIRFPFFFLVLMIPVPYVYMITSPAQIISVFSAANLANLIGIPTVRDGLILTIPAGAFEVGVECSGINSLISLFTIGIIFAYVLEGSNLMKATVIISTIPLALAGNILRITLILIIASMYGQEAAINYFHDFSSLLLFSIALIGLFLVGRCFGRLRFKKIF
jgi:exosortase